MYFLAILKYPLQNVHLNIFPFKINFFLFFLICRCPLFIPRTSSALHMVSKYFLSVCVLSFHFLHEVFQRTGGFILKATLPGSCRVLTFWIKGTLDTWMPSQGPSWSERMALGESQLYDSLDLEFVGSGAMQGLSRRDSPCGGDPLLRRRRLAKLQLQICIPAVTASSHPRRRTRRKNRSYQQLQICSSWKLFIKPDGWWQSKILCPLISSDLPSTSVPFLDF